MSPLLLDLCCGGGGAAMGYHRAGFDVVGVDINPQPHYPFTFHQADALTFPLDGYDAIHASPPCQAYVALAARDGRHPRLIEPVRARLRASGLPYVIENVPGAPLENPVQLCGSSFGLGVRRHRLFESNVLVLVPRCHRSHTAPIRAYYGRPSLIAWQAPQNSGRVARGENLTPLYRGTVDQAVADMGIDWMTWDELREAIPPAYTEYIGAQLLAHLGVTA